jgi:hypothetical protein
MDENTRNEEIKKLEDKLSYLQEWIDRLKEANKVAQEVQQQIELVRWKIGVLKNLPPEADEIPFDPPKAEKDLDYTKSAIRQIPTYDRSALTNSTATTVSGTTDYYNFVTRIGDLNTQNAITFSGEFIEQYHSMQRSQDRQRMVRQMVEKLGNPQTVNRFDKAVDAFSLYKTGVGDRTSTALQIRTLLDGVQGTLFEKARNHAKENMTWGKMGSRLARIQPNSEDYNQFIMQYDVRSRLYSRLSDIGKDREGGSVTNLEYIWPQVVDHLYVTLSLLGLR